MYLAHLHTGSRVSYQIRQSFQPAAGIFRYRIVYDLGEDPTSFIEPFTDHIVLFNEDLLQAVEHHTNREGNAILEQLLYRFLPEEMQRRIDLFPPRSAGQTTSALCKNEKNIPGHIHLFDRKRLYYLRYGAVDQSRLSRLHEKCCVPLLDMSRDQREYFFAAEELVLSPGDYQQYIFAIFDIQKHFHQSFAPWFPEALAKDEIVEHFLEAICRLNRDKAFWIGESINAHLHHHLVRYLIMFFDFSPDHRSFTHEFAESFMRDHRQFKWPGKNPPQTPEKISKIFSTPYNTLKTLSKEQLNKLYRKKAMKLHPDKGGDHDLFVELTEIYQHLRRKFKTSSS